MKYLITIIAYARTGTNYFAGLLDQSFKNINSNYELFNNKKCFINEKYKNLITTQNFDFLCKSNPLLLIDKLIEFSEEPIISHKLFPEHLDLNIVYRIINKSNYIFILKRNFLDVYISKKRALKMIEEGIVDPWVNVNTTNYKVDFVKDEYLTEKKLYDEWYDNTINYIKVNNKKYIIIDYDDFHKKNILEQQIFIQELLKEIIPKDLLKINKDVSLLKKQDTSTDYSTKINNY